MTPSALRTTFSLVLLLLLAPLTVHAGFPSGQGPGTARGEDSTREWRPAYKEGEILVKFKPGVPEERKENLHKKHKSRKIKEFKSLRLQHVKLPEGMSVEDAVELYRASPDVEYAEPDGIYHLLATPNDPGYGQLWGLARIGAPAAWDLTTGSSSVVVAVIDSGVDYSHPDLAANMWVNPNEIPGNGVDDDRNGYTDDVYGIDAVANTSNPADLYGHGTHVAGTIGAVGNNATGIAGINWGVRILACKAGDAGDSIYVDAAIECLQYVRVLKDRGVNIVATNNSWGGNFLWQSLSDAIEAQGDIIFIASAGNDYDNNDKTPVYPASFPLSNIISVAATTATDTRATFSNYGRRSVHVGAPGAAIYSTVPGNSYASWDGTSMAAPHVTGLAALLKAHDPGLGAYGIRNLILSGGDAAAGMSGSSVTGKRINAYGSLNCSNGKAFSVLSYPGAISVGTPVTLTALSVACQLAAGPVTATTSANETITLHDDGVAPDLNAGDGVFSGTWTPARVSEVLTFTSPAGSETIVIAPLAVTSSYVHEGNTRARYSYFLTAKGGLPPYSWSVTGSLPPGLALDTGTGELTGTPTVAGSYSFSATVTDGFNLTASKSLTLRVVNDAVVEVWGVPYDYGYSESSDAVAVDRSGNIFVTGFTTSGMGAAIFVTTKQDPSGAVQWSGTFWDALTSGFAYWPHGVATDSNGNVFVSGERYSSTGYICRYLKYTPSGTRLWYMTNRDGRCYGVAVGSDNSLFLSGTKNGSPSAGMVMKANNDGAILWNKTIDLGTNLFLRGIAADGAGNVYVTGMVNDADGTTDLLLAKLDPGGNLAWWTRYGDAGANEGGERIATDAAGNVYVAGGSSTRKDNLVLKYDPAGTIIWARTYHTGSSTSSGIATDAAGSVYVSSPQLLKYSSGGDLLWSRAVGSDNVTGVAVDPSGNIVVSSDFGGDYLTLKYAELPDNGPPTITTTALPNAVMGSYYGETLTATGGSPPYSWSLFSPLLPEGLSLAATGLISGIPSKAGVYSFASRVADSWGAAATRSLAITVNETACSNAPVRIEGASASYADIPDAYAQATDNALIKLQSLDFTSDLLFNRDLRVTLSGGYDCGYTANASAAVLSGKLRVTSGTVRLDKVRFM